MKRPHLRVVVLLVVVFLAAAACATTGSVEPVPSGSVEPVPAMTAALSAELQARAFVRACGGVACAGRPILAPDSMPPAVRDAIREFAAGVVCADVSKIDDLSGPDGRFGGGATLIEVGYIPFDPDAASLFYQLVSSRYEQSSLIVSSNKTFSAWAEIFGDAVAVEAMVDRLVHHSHILTLKGDS